MRQIRKLLEDAESKVNHLEDLLHLREGQLDSYEKQINTISSGTAEMEIELSALRTDNDTMKADMAALRELCDKLDQQKEKLQNELDEHSNIRQQLQEENEKLRHEKSAGNPCEKAQIEGLNELLQQTRQDYETQKISTSQLNSELQRLRDHCDQLQEQLQEEQENAKRKEALAERYCKQIRELKNLISDDKFDESQSKGDVGNRYSTLPY